MQVTSRIGLFEEINVTPQPTRHWQLRSTRLTFGRLPKIMGIVNVTPDSFSDGGQFEDPERAVEHGLQLVDEGADMLDIGGESTRPYSEPVPVEIELERVAPVVERLAAQTSVPISIDTSKADVARQALELGAEVINDVTGLESEPEMVAVARKYEAGVCAMHMRGRPPTMQDDPTYENVVNEIHEYLQWRRDALVQNGIAIERICLDPGIGFGKTHEHNLTLLSDCGQFHDLECPILIGHSRKGLIGKLLGDKEADRTFGSIGVALAVARQGVQILRVHDVLATRQALKLFAASGGVD